MLPNYLNVNEKKDRSATEAITGAAVNFRLDSIIAKSVVIIARSGAALIANVSISYPVAIAAIGAIAAAAYLINTKIGKDEVNLVSEIIDDGI